MLIIGVVALAGNAAATWVLARGQRDDINLEAVLRHSAADALGSIGVIVSGAVILATGWRPIDPLVEHRDRRRSSSPRRFASFASRSTS